MRPKAAGCASTNARGEPCGMAPLDGTHRCFAHSDERAADRAKARKRGGRNRRAGKATDAPTEAAPLRGVVAIQRQLETALFNVLQLENSNARSRTVGYLLQIGLKALEVGDLEERLAAIEGGAENRTEEDGMSIESRLRTLEAANGPQEPVSVRVYWLPPEAIDLRGAALQEWCRAHPGEYKTHLAGERDPWGVA